MHIEVQPTELVFQDVQLHQAYQARVELYNPYDAPVDLVIKPSAGQRYQVRPERVHIDAESSTTVVVRLKVMHFPNKKKAKAGQRDYFHMKSRYFEQKFFTTFYLLGTPEKEQKLPKRIPQPKKISSNSSRPTRKRQQPTSGNQQGIQRTREEPKNVERKGFNL